MKLRGGEGEGFGLRGVLLRADESVDSVSIISPSVSSIYSAVCAHRIDRVPELQTAVWTGELKIIYRLQQRN